MVSGGDGVVALFSCFRACSSPCIAYIAVHDADFDRLWIVLRLEIK